MENLVKCPLCNRKYHFSRAVVLDEDLLVYYGGADTVSCVARANLASFVSDLTQHHVGELKNIEL